MVLFPSLDICEPTSRLLSTFCQHFLIDDGTLDTENDLLMAQLLQLEFNKEYDEFIKAKEKIINKDSNGWYPGDNTCF